ncbi:Guanylate kinase [Buchnera aphidicola (Eriosoma grossulariae)]|uniref:guanylate kinase n=1 Tax=Buchnera aphidicola TaxID=9 RepID=UPI00346497B1
MNTGILFIVSAPSGTGKSSLIQAFLKKTVLCDVHVSISHTTRKIRPGEYHGKHYYFISKKKFLQMIQEQDFLEYAKVFNHYYGTSKTIINHYLSNGLNIFLDIDWQGAQQIRKKILTARSIFILPPSKLELYRRLQTRGQDTNQVISKRMRKAVSEMQHYVEYDYLIINDEFNLAVSHLELIIRAEQLNINRQKHIHKNLIKKLITQY